MTRTSEYEALNADQLIAERKGREQWLDELPKSSFSKELTAMILEANEFVWKTENQKSFIQVDQERAIEELGEIEFDKKCG